MENIKWIAAVNMWLVACLLMSGASNTTSETSVKNETDFNATSFKPPLSFDVLELKLTLALFDNKVAFYFDNTISKNTSWFFQPILKAWVYAKQTFGPFGPDPILYIILHHNEKYAELEYLKTPPSTKARFKNAILVVIPKLQNCNWNVFSNHGLDYLLNVIGIITLRTAMGIGNWPTYEVSKWEMKDIITYDLYLKLNKSNEAMRWANEKSEESIEVPVENTHWFRDWYYPIYTHCDGVDALRKFFSLLYLYWPKKGTDYDEELNVGEFVHFWSEAAGTDLKYLAMRTFPWSEKYFIELENARKIYSHFNYSEMKSNSPFVLPPLHWTETWYGHKQNLTLSQYDGNIAFYFDTTISKRTLWFFQLVSDTWASAKQRFGPFGPDPILYFVFHDKNLNLNSQISKSKSYNDFAFANRMVLDVSADLKSLTDLNANSVSDLALLFSGVGNSILRIAMGSGNYPAYKVSGWSMADILAYDIYLNLTNSKEAARIAKEMASETEENIHWLRDWYYPIYKYYGGVDVLRRFFILLHSYWPRKRTDYDKELNYGEFVHFWSAAAGTDLSFLVYEGFEWTEQNFLQLKSARRAFPDFNYELIDSNSTFTPLPLQWTENWDGHHEWLKLAGTDGDVTFYFDQTVPMNTSWFFQPIFQVWSYLKQTYELISPDINLFIILHNGRNLDQFTIVQSDSFSTKFFENKIIIDCESQSPNGWNSETGSAMETIISIVSSAMLNNAEKFGEWPAKDVSQYEIKSILIYDVYLALNRTQEAQNMLMKFMERKITTPLKDTYWFKNWFYPSYLNFGGKEVLSRFFTLVKSYWATNTVKYDRQMNMGEMIHFWSEAAGSDVSYLCQKLLNSKCVHSKQLSDARKEFPCFNYTVNEEEYLRLAPTDKTDSNVVTVGIYVSAGVGVLILLFALCVIYALQRRNKKLQLEIRKLTKHELNEFFLGEPHSNQTSGNLVVDTKGFNMDFKVSRDSLQIDEDKVLGSGEYGIVLQGMYFHGNHSAGNVEATTVAVKIPKPNVDVVTFKALLMELKVMANLGRHENIAALIGAVTDRIKHRELVVALEFCANGDLLSYMKKHRMKFKDLIHDCNVSTTHPDLGHATVDIELQVLNDDSIHPQIEFSTLNLLQWSIHICNGMAYLSSKKVIHGDLAARNVLLTENKVAKISDFGLSRQLVNYSNYQKESKTPLPWRWMALESLRDMEFSLESDIWSLGVTLYEVFALGSTPYATCNWTLDFVQKLSAGFRLEMPEFANSDIFHIIMDCMRKEPEERIKCPEIIANLTSIYSVIENKMCKGSASSTTYVTF